MFVDLRAALERLAADAPSWSPELARDLVDAGQPLAACELAAAELDLLAHARSPAFAALHDLARELGADPACLATLARAAARLSVLSLAPGVRAGGHGKTERHYRDLLIDGRSLTALAANDKIPPFGWLAGADRASADALLGKPSLPELRTDGAERAVVLVCGECGDLGCGALTLAVDVDPSGDVVTWRDLGTQTDFEAGFHPRPDLGPYRFARADYLAVIAELRAGSAR